MGITVIQVLGLVIAAILFPFAWFVDFVYDLKDEVVDNLTDWL